ncbi:unnamed protein product [Durusdinium trenchii]|uniref:Uncharacterized protein n=1 Tax=Durusdinium trenchii TaxID=1381693 RepID=A0ABP0PAL7_9DINO
MQASPAHCQATCAQSALRHDLATAGEALPAVAPMSCVQTLGRVDSDLAWRNGNFHAKAWARRLREEVEHEDSPPVKNQTSSKQALTQDAHAAPSPLKGDPFSSTTVATNEVTDVAVATPAAAPPSDSSTGPAWREAGSQQFC